MAGYALAMLLAATMAWSCTDDSVGADRPEGRRAGPGLPDRRVDWTGRRSQHRRSDRAGGFRHRDRARSRSRFVLIQRARAASGRGGEVPPGGSPRAVQGAGSRPVASVHGARHRAQLPAPARWDGRRGSAGRGRSAVRRAGGGDGDAGTESDSTSNGSTACSYGCAAARAVPPVGTAPSEELGMDDSTKALTFNACADSTILS